MKNKKTIVKLSMLLILIIAITISVTYAYFQFKVNGVESSTTIIVDATQLSIEYVGSNMIEASKISPSWSEKKYFSININNETNKSVNFSINVVVDDSNFYTTASPNLGYLNYKLTKCTDKNDTECTEVIQDSTLLNIQSGQKLIANISETAGTKTNYYALEFIYPDTGVPQKQRGEDGLLYHFSGFVTLGSASSEGTNLNMATITIDLDGGTYNGNTTVSIPYGELYYLEFPQKEGYQFKEWEIVSGTAEVSGKGLIANSSTVSVKAIYKSNIPEPVSFASDSWATIAANVQANKEATASVYKVGDEKAVEIDVNGDGTAESFTVRIANNSHYDSDCKDDQGNTYDSKTACGFVVEFVDIIEKRQMNSDNTNVGGWPATAMYQYLNGTYDKDTKKWNRNNTIYSKLPDDLQKVIADTTVISGHGSTNGEANFESTDKIYLLSTKEVWIDGTSNIVSSYDTAYSTTRQLDYYEGKGVTTNNYGEAKKNFNGTAAWWLRASSSSSSNSFMIVYSDGHWTGGLGIDSNVGLAPAFRIG